jgi:hypothetical protein
VVLGDLPSSSIGATCRIYFWLAYLGIGEYCSSNIGEEVARVPLKGPGTRGGGSRRGTHG